MAKEISFCLVQGEGPSSPITNLVKLDFNVWIHPWPYLELITLLWLLRFVCEDSTNSIHRSLSMGVPYSKSIILSDQNKKKILLWTKMGE